VAASRSGQRNNRASPGLKTPIAARGWPLSEPPFLAGSDRGRRFSLAIHRPNGIFYG
jgi:hypothetical protein